MNYVDFIADNARSLDELEKSLLWLMSNNCEIIESPKGVYHVYEKRAVFARINGIKIVLYPRDHSLPHFHVSVAEFNATFSIEDCSYLAGKLKNSDFIKVKYWHSRSKDKLIEFWKNSRPTT